MQLLSNLDYFFVRGELASSFDGAYFTRAYLLEDGTYRFKFHKKGEFNLLVELGKRVHLSNSYAKTSEDQDAVANTCRNFLDNAKIKSIEQFNFDRLIAFEFNNKTLVFEMFSDGAVLLLDTDKKIIFTSHKAEFSARTLKKGEVYKTPPSTKIHPGDLKVSDLSAATGKVVSSLSKLVNLSPFYLEEAASRAGVELSEKIETLSEAMKKKLVKEINGLVDEKLSPVVYVKDGTPVFFAPFSLTKLRDYEEKRFETFSGALDFYFANAARDSSAVTAAAKKREDKVKSLENRLATQMESINNFEKSEREATEKATWILTHSAEVAELSEIALKNPEKLKGLKKVEKKGSELIINV